MQKLAFVLIFALQFNNAAFATKITKRQFITYRNKYIRKYSNYHIEYVRDFYKQLRVYSSSTPIVKATKFSEKIRSSRLILMGDLHNIQRSQKNTDKVLRMLAETGDPITFVIEWVNHEDQQHLDDFMQDKTTEEEFRKRVRYNQNWGFAWQPHISLLRTCKELSIRVLAVDQRGAAQNPLSLKDRDIVIAERTIKDVKTRPNDRYLLAFGTAHTLGPDNKPHLMKHFQTRGHGLDMMIVPTSNDAYFQELEKVLDDDLIPIVRYRDNDLFFFNTGLESLVDMDPNAIL